MLQMWGGRAALRVIVWLYWAAHLESFQRGLAGFATQNREWSEHADSGLAGFVAQRFQKGDGLDDLDAVIIAAQRVEMRIVGHEVIWQYRKTHF